jgi:formate hydrogenlyase subunit 3/multisubunit Na+/H+ antiporter MnhD subunit
MDVHANSVILLSVPVVPLFLATGLISGLMRRYILILAPWAALPALIISLLMPIGTTIELPWLLLGSHLGFDETARIFLFFTSLLWLVAGIYSTGYFSEAASRTRFFIWFLFAMAGNLGLILAQDMVLFYTFFALMSFASYGLVVFDRTLEALRAGRIYIVLVVVGEVMLFAAFLLAAQTADDIEFEAVQTAIVATVSQDWIIGLTLLGFGTKAGVIGLHVWLPLAHPVAPTPASAVLSGAMISAGLLGWLRMLPLGETALPDWGSVMIIAGLAAVFYAVFVGLMQKNAKTVLAYSSINCMGIMTIAVGLGLVAPVNWSLLLIALLIYALQHGLAKGALFLGTDMATASPISRGQRYLLITGLLLPALSLAGAPLTSGMIAKHLIHVQVVSVASFWGEWLQILLPWGSVATSMLLTHFLMLVWPRQITSSGIVKSSMMWLPWTVLFLVVAVSPGFIPHSELKDFGSITIMAGALWPVALGSSLTVIIWWLSKCRQVRLKFSIPSGDILIIVENWIFPTLKSGLSSCVALLQKGWLWLLASVNNSYDHLTSTSFLEVGENRFRRWVTGTTLFLILIVALVFFASQSIL